MSLFQQAVNYNNYGIHALVEGDHKIAVHAMTTSMEYMKLALLACPEAEPSLYGYQRNSLSTRTMVVPSMESSVDTAVLFNRLIHIPNIPDGYILTPIDLNVYTSATIYNLALAYQSLKDHGSAHQVSSYEKKAEKLYGLAIKLLEEDTLSSIHTISQHTALVVKLGCINNLSHIRYSNGEYENLPSSSPGSINEISKCLGMMQYQQHQYHQGSTMMMFDEEPEILGLLMNIILLKPPSVAPAA